VGLVGGRKYGHVIRGMKGGESISFIIYKEVAKMKEFPLVQREPNKNRKKGYSRGKSETWSRLGLIIKGGD